MAVRAIQANVNAGCVHREFGGVPEWCLTGRWEPGDESRRTKIRIIAVAEILTPGLVFGWLESASDGAGNVFYKLTPSGELRWNGEAIVPTFTPPNKYDAELAQKTADDYLAETIAARHVMAGLPPVDDLAIPLSCGFTPSADLACPPILDRDGRLIESEATP